MEPWFQIVNILLQALNPKKIVQAVDCMPPSTPGVTRGCTCKKGSRLQDLPYRRFG